MTAGRLLCVDSISLQVKLTWRLLSGRRMQLWPTLMRPWWSETNRRLSLSCLILGRMGLCLSSVGWVVDPSAELFACHRLCSMDHGHLFRRTT